MAVQKNLQSNLYQLKNKKINKQQQQTTTARTIKNNNKKKIGLTNIDLT